LTFRLLFSKWDSAYKIIKREDFKMDFPAHPNFWKGYF
jgi:hypothetical protein